MASASALERGRHRFMDEAAHQERTPQQENTQLTSLEERKEPPLHTTLPIGLDDDTTPISITSKGHERRCRCLRRAFAKLRIPGDDSEDGPQMSAFIIGMTWRRGLVFLLCCFLFGLLVGAGIDLVIFKAAGMFWTQWLAAYSAIGAVLFSVRLLIAHLYRGGGSRKFEEIYDLVIFIFFFILVHVFAAQATNTTWEFHTQEYV